MKTQLEPVYLTVDESVQRWRVGRTKFYELLQAGAFRTIKVGRRTLIEIRSGDAFFAGLPSASSARGNNAIHPLSTSC